MKKTSKRISLLLRKKGFFMCTTSMLLANVSVFASPDAAKTSLLPAKSDVASVAIVAQQGKTITGVVMDSQESIIGANVMVKGTTNGTITDMDGKFTLINVPENAILVVSYIGYLDREIPVAGKSTLEIRLKEDTQKLDEVVVVGYGVQKKVNMTGSISNVKADDLSVIPSTNLSNSLAGRAPGATITGNSGLMGAKSEIRMRGGFGDPLFVIDGVIRDKEAFDLL